MASHTLLACPLETVVHGCFRAENGPHIRSERRELGHKSGPSTESGDPRLTRTVAVISNVVRSSPISSGPSYLSRVTAMNRSTGPGGIWSLERWTMCE
jgi:hypothetical protein